MPRTQRFSKFILSEIIETRSKFYETIDNNLLINMTNALVKALRQASQGIAPL